jgi:hypothetical protein
VASFLPTDFVSPLAQQAAGQLLWQDLVLFLLELNDLDQFALGELGEAPQKGGVHFAAGSQRAKARTSMLAFKMTMCLHTARAPSLGRQSPCIYIVTVPAPT